ncbi:helix-turn-helix domain-containing protein [Chryseobacterium sp. SL1]|uniref:helix-turn-helix domain-containing protein n=1 Tax=Chryseobacterium sp. SL1 TaxID=2995159 RepID=UPI0022730D86|nr:helix-turn-helix domain-containing protein [Chryseobacterium sp. SL1]MCY1662503.1 helix-turn-helix domain-containing protein [Chryseobacterium sp. SL1]
MKKELKPNYKLIFSDILDKKYPEKRKDCSEILNKKSLTTFDIIHLNHIIFGKNEQNKDFNQKHRSYKKSDIMKIVEHQKKYNMSNIETSLKFKISRNTIYKWKKLYKIKNAYPQILLSESKDV